MSSIQNINTINKSKTIYVETEKIKAVKTTEINGIEKKENLEINSNIMGIKNVEIKTIENEPIKNNNNIEVMYKKALIEKEDTCKKCPLRFLVFIPFFIFYLILSLIDFIIYLIVPLFYCIFYTITCLCLAIFNICSSFQIEEEIGFSGAFTSENDISLEINRNGGLLHLKEIICFSYMNACVRRYCCFLCVLINHITLSILQAWNRAKKCFFQSEIEKEYDKRKKLREDASSYKGYETFPKQVEIINI